MLSKYTEEYTIEWAGAPETVTISYLSLGDGFITVTAKVGDYIGRSSATFSEIVGLDSAEASTVAKEYGLNDEAIAEARISHYRTVINPAF